MSGPAVPLGLARRLPSNLTGYGMLATKGRNRATLNNSGHWSYRSSFSEADFRDTVTISKGRTLVPSKL